MVGAIGTCGGGAGVPAAGCVALVPESNPCDTPTTSQALKATSARAQAAKTKTTRPRRELKVLFNAPSSVDRRRLVFRSANNFSDIRSTEAKRWRMTTSLESQPATPLSQACRLRPEALRLRLAADLPTETPLNIRPERRINSRLRHRAQHVAGRRHRAAARCRQLVTGVSRARASVEVGSGKNLHWLGSSDSSAASIGVGFRNR